MAIFTIFALIGAYGCIQPTQAERCATQSGIERDRCLNETAIWYQEPYICYSITDTTLRQACLEKSVDAQEAQKLQQELLYGRIMVEEQEIPLVLEKDKTELRDEQSRVLNVTIDSKIEECVITEKMSQEACTRLVAIETSDMSLCERINDDNYRASCISNIALTKKDPTMCSSLKRAGDINVCKYYTSGE